MLTFKSLEKALKKQVAKQLPPKFWFKFDRITNTQSEESYLRIAVGITTLIAPSVKMELESKHYKLSELREHNKTCKTYLCKLIYIEPIVVF